MVGAAVRGKTTRERGVRAELGRLPTAIEKKKGGEAGLIRPNVTQCGQHDMLVGTDKTEAAETSKVGKDKTEAVEK